MEVLIVFGYFLVFIIAFLLLRLAIIKAIVAIKFIMDGAIRLFAFAGDQNFIGLVVYIACWVFLLPVMTFICWLIGYMAEDKEETRKFKEEILN